MHGFPGIPDPPPLELRARIRQQAIEAGAEHRVSAVTSVGGKRDAFEVQLHNDDVASARRIVLAYGLRDFVPDVAGISSFYGHSVYHCPDCDGPSVRGQRVGVLGCDRSAAALALYLLTWTPHVSLLTNATAVDLTGSSRAILHQQKIEVVEDAILALDGQDGCLSEVSFGSHALPFDALFFHLGSEPRCSFANDYGCTADEHGYIDVDRGQQTSVAGLYAAGDIAGTPHLAATAAAAGVRAALAIHRSLLPDSFFLDG